MNRDAIQKVINALRTVQHVDGDYEAVECMDAGVPTFSMTNYFFECGTPGCIAGWAAHLNGYGKGHDTMYMAMAYLEIPHRLAAILFLADGVPSPLCDISPQDAIKALENVLGCANIEHLTTRSVWNHMFEKGTSV